MDRRSLPGLAVGTAGSLAGIAAAVLGARLLGLAAALGAIIAAAIAFGLGSRLQRAEKVAASAEAALAVADTRVQAALAEVAAATAKSSAKGGPETVMDSETGLLDERVFAVTFERKIAAARRHLRPLSLVLIDLHDGLPEHARDRARALATFGSVVRQTLRDADVACRLGRTAFGLILEDTPEAGGVWAAERLQIAIACNGAPLTRLAASVATYPNHGLKAEEVLLRARAALARACAGPREGFGSVVVANADPG